MARTCPKCREALGRQRTYHMKRDPKGYNGKSWCNGPRQLPPPSGVLSGKPKHFRDFGSVSRSLCGIVAGNLSGKYVSGDAEVPYSRVTVKLTEVTCETCLIMLIQRSKQRLHARLKAVGPRNAKELLREAHGRERMHQLRKLVGA